MRKVRFLSTRLTPRPLVMTNEQFRKAEKLEKEKLLVQSIIAEIESPSAFKETVPNNDVQRTMRYALKPRYQDVVVRLRHIVSEIEIEFRNLSLSHPLTGKHMKAQELRVGNITFDVDGNVQVIDAIEILAIRQCEAASHPVEFVKPINLTKDWIERLGLEWDIYWQGHTDGNWVLTPGHDDGNWRISYGKRRADIIVWDVKYVHQLQNLYFALTGTELKLIL
jgi:hypothetical protein